MTTTERRRLASAYLEAYNRAMRALRDVENMIHDNPAPDSEIEINWGHVGDMDLIATKLEMLLPENP